MHKFEKQEKEAAKCGVIDLDAHLSSSHIASFQVPGGGANYVLYSPPARANRVGHMASVEHTKPRPEEKMFERGSRIGDS
jgi:hypothetical protein